MLHRYDDALVWFNDKDPASGIGLGRGYGQVCRRRLREELLGRCQKAGVKYAPGLVDTLVHGDAEKAGWARLFHHAHARSTQGLQPRCEHVIFF